MPPPRDLEPVSGQKQSGWGEPRVPGRAREDPDLLDWERPRMARTRRSSPPRRPVRRAGQPPGNRPRRESAWIQMAGLDSGERPGGGRREPRIRSSAWTYSAKAVGPRSVDTRGTRCSRRRQAGRARPGPWGRCWLNRPHSVQVDSASRGRGKSGRCNSGRWTARGVGEMSLRCGDCISGHLGRFRVTGRVEAI